MQYGTTSDFLRCFGLKSIEDLPSASEELMNMFEKTREKEESDREIDENQISIEDIDPQSEEAPTEQSTETASTTDNGADEGDTDTVQTLDVEDPSAEDDIIDVD